MDSIRLINERQWLLMVHCPNNIRSFVLQFLFAFVVLSLVLSFSWPSSFSFRDCKGSRISQIYVNSIFQNSFLQIIQANTDLSLYEDSNAPAFFYGVMTDEAYETLRRHKSMAVIIFTGIELQYEQRVVDFARLHRDRVFTVAISEFMERSLRKLGLYYLKCPFFPLDLSAFHPVKKGNGVYVYGLPDSVYHSNLVLERVRKHFPETPFYFSAHLGANNSGLPEPYKHYERETLLKEIYPSCFLGIRLTENDGLAGGVQEMGMMGIRSVWNGATPSAIAWKDMDDVVEAVRREKETIGKMDVELSERVKKFLTIPDEFYHVCTYRTLRYSSLKLDTLALYIRGEKDGENDKEGKHEEREQSRENRCNCTRFRGALREPSFGMQ